jgi:hypothetical protein
MSMSVLDLERNTRADRDGEWIGVYQRDQRHVYELLSSNEMQDKPTSHIAEHDSGAAMHRE